MDDENEIHTQSQLERSAGAIVFKRSESGDTRVLLIRHRFSSHWAFPKGHIEPHETEERAAVREVQEETGIHIKIECDFRQQVFYRINNKISKQVTYFLAVDRQNQIIRNCDSKIASVIWKDVKYILERLNFKNDKNLFTNALAYIERHEELF